MSKRERDAGFDNLKGILIYLVVFGHILSKLLSASVPGRMFRAAIFAVHMPAFVFISGYFSKNAARADAAKLVKSTLLPFALIQIVVQGVILLSGNGAASTILNPYWTTWYLLCLFVWRLLVTPVSKIRYSLVWSVVLALCIGFTTADRVLTFSRMVTFFPYFLAGYLTSADSLARLRKMHWAIPAAALASVFATAVAMHIMGHPVLTFLQMAAPYSQLTGCTEWHGLLYRALALLMGFLGTASLIALVPSKPCILSQWGACTMPVYLGHSFIILLLRALVRFMPHDLLALDAIMIPSAMMLAVCICKFLGNQRAADLYRKGIDRIASIVLLEEKEKAGK